MTTFYIKTITDVLQVVVSKYSELSSHLSAPFVISVMAAVQVQLKSGAETINLL